MKSTMWYVHVVISPRFPGITHLPTTGVCNGFERHGRPLKESTNSGALALVFVTLCEEPLAVVIVRS
jgi:hypothetical protein